MTVSAPKTTALALKAVAFGPKVVTSAVKVNASDAETVAFALKEVAFL